jgi:flagellar biosynthesis/type III secretory pathway protein FliH
MDFYCGVCGELLGDNVRGGSKGIAEIEPCEKCLENAKNEGYKNGYDEGYEKGMEDKE